MHLIPPEDVPIYIVTINMLPCFRILKDIHLTSSVFSVIVDFLSHASPPEQNRIIGTVVEEASTLNGGIVISVS